MIAADLALYYPTEFRAVVGLEAALTCHGPKEAQEMADKILENKEHLKVDDVWGFVKHPRANQDGNGIFMYGLCGPNSPEPLKREVAWCYSQGAPSVFAGDIWYYAYDHDLR